MTQKLFIGIALLTLTLVISIPSAIADGFLGQDLEGVADVIQSSGEGRLALVMTICILGIAVGVFWITSKIIKVNLEQTASTVANANDMVNANEKVVLTYKTLAEEYKDRLSRAEAAIERMKAEVAAAKKESVTAVGSQTQIYQEVETRFSELLTERQSEVNELAKTNDRLLKAYREAKINEANTIAKFQELNGRLAGLSALYKALYTELEQIAHRKGDRAKMDLSAYDPKRLRM